MLVKDIMNKNVVIAKPEITVREASTAMNKFHIGSLVIVKDNNIVGILTERDILTAVAEGKDLERTLAEEIMTKNVITIEPGKRIEDAVNLMTEHKIKKLPVVDDGKLVGIVTASDIIVVEPKLIETVANLLSIRMPGYRGG
jgi:CBS domain-containing protein